MDLRIVFLNFVLLSLSVSLCNALVAQKSYDIELPKRVMNINDCYFYIDQITDLREETSNIGTVLLDEMNTPAAAVFTGSLQANLKGLFIAALPFETDYIPLNMIVKKFELSEDFAKNRERSIFQLEVEFLHEGVSVFTYEWNTYISARDALISHGDNVFKGLEMCFQELAVSLYKKGLYGGLPYKYSSYSSDAEDYMPDSDEKKKYDYQFGERNVSSIGYQIGGITLIGYNYEVRLNDAFGVHFGGGIFGYTGGIKIHTRPDKKAPFVNLSFKDAGFGSLQGAAAEYGGTLIRLNQSSGLGVHFQIGVLAIIAIEPAFKRTLFGASRTPDALLSFGIGLNW